MGELNAKFVTIGFLAFYFMYALHKAYNTPYDWILLFFGSMLLAWYLPDWHAEQFVRMNSWIMRLSNGKK